MMVGTPRLLADDLVFPEGPRWRSDRLWFSDMHAGEVVAIDLDGRRETVLQVSGKPSGLGFLPDGRALVVSMEDNQLLRLDPGGPAVHADLSGLAVLCNDMVVDASGRAYVGNMGFNTFAGAEYRPGSLILVTPEGQARTVATAMALPNGAVITPDGHTLIVAESRGPRLTAFDIAADGSLRNRRVWAPVEAMPDGICLDAEGCVWVAIPTLPGRFVRLAEGGAVRQRIETGEYKAIACELGGPDGKTLFLLEALEGKASLIKGRGNGRLRAVEVETPAANRE